jgi:hypothetical protein
MKYKTVTFTGKLITRIYLRTEWLNNNSDWIKSWIIRELWFNPRGRVFPFPRSIRNISGKHLTFSRIYIENSFLQGETGRIVKLTNLFNGMYVVLSS